MKEIASILLAIAVFVGSNPYFEHDYVGNKNTKKFHKISCWTLPKEENRIYFDEREDAIEEKFKPCGNCKP